MTDAQHLDVEFQWRAAPLTQALVTCAAVALGVAVVGSYWQLVAFAAPLLGVLCSFGWQPRVPAVRLHARPALLRCFESEQTELSVWATTESEGSDVAPQLGFPAGNGLDIVDVACGAPGARHTITAQARRWGRYSIRTDVRVLGRGGLLVGTATVDAAEIFVFPVAPAQSTALPRTELLDRLGTHLTRHTGPGVEYADIRPFVPGDQLRAVNWPVSARRGSLHITERLTDRSADVVVLIDTYAQPAGPATEATEWMARGAAQVVQSALRNGDRAGVVTLGGRKPRWLGPDIGQRQFYRILDTILGAPCGFQTATGTLAPRAAVPVGAVVIAFSTLLDTEFALALIELRKSGHEVVAVDVLQGFPLEGEHDPLLARMWTLQRSFMYRDMATIGVDVLPWQIDSTLDQSMNLLSGRRGPVRGRARR